MTIIIGGKLASLTMGNFTNIGDGGRIVCSTDDFKQGLISPVVPQSIVQVYVKPIVFEDFPTLGVQCSVLPSSYFKRGNYCRSKFSDNIGYRTLDNIWWVTLNLLLVREIVRRHYNMQKSWGINMRDYFKDKNTLSIPWVESLFFYSLLENSDHTEEVKEMCRYYHENGYLNY